MRQRSRFWVVLLIVSGMFSIVQAVPSATAPVPALGVQIDPDETVVSWTPGDGALRSEIYLGTDPAAVAAAMKPAGDVNGDGAADIADLACLAVQWLESPMSPCPDLDISGRVDLGDFKRLSSDWGVEAGPLYLGSTTGRSIDLGELRTNTTYYWRVDSVRCDGIAVGPVWSFKTKVPAFPGAEGFGKWARGGRGGSVYHVTNLNDSGPGSFRDAVSATNRTVVFDVGGVINIGERIIVSKDITIAGQTAPGEGIVIYGNGLSYTDANRSITRYMRYRMGRGGTSGKDALTIADGTDMIFDHCSIAWGRDENFSISGGSGEDPGFITIQNCIIAQGLETHSCGGLIQDFNGVSLLRNLYIDNDTRNPKVKGINDFTNNVVYNWDDAAYILGDSAADSYANVINNYFISGGNTGSAAFTRGNLYFHIYASNNWHDSDRDGVPDGRLLTQSDYGTVDWQTTPYAYSSVKTLLDPLTAVKVAASAAGAVFPVRDRNDTRLISELRSWGTSGGLISDENTAPMYGVGRIEGGIAPADTDRDGMPDYWEASIAGLNPAAADNNGDLDGDGYTNLEEYLNWLGAPHAHVQKNAYADIDLRQFTSGFDSGAAYTVFDAEHGTAAMQADGYTVRFTPETDYLGLARFRFTVDDGSRYSDTVGLLVSEYGGEPLDPVYPVDVSNGLDYRYYTGTWQYLPDFDALTPAGQGMIANFSIASAPAADGFGYVFEGYIEAPVDGQYTFYSHSDDGSRIYIDDRVIVSNDGVHGSREVQGRAALRAGLHKIRVTYFENDGNQRLEVRWAGPGFGKQWIPNGSLYRGDMIPPAVPTGLRAIAGNGTVSLDWYDNGESDLAGYNVYRTTVSGSGYVKLNASPVVPSSYTDLTAVNGTLYHYVISAVDDFANESGRTLEVSALPAAAGSSTIIQEHTVGFCGVDGTVDSDNGGFTGAGFANSDNSTGSGINWRVHVSSGGAYTLRWRFANGGGADRPGRLLIDGAQVVSSVSFPATGGWTSWTENSQAISLTAGSHTIRLEATTSGGLANIDYVMLSGASPSPEECP